MNILIVDALRAELRRKDKITVCEQCHVHRATDVHHLNGVHHDNRPENLAPWCKCCHNEHHGISDNLTILCLLARQYADIQVQRVAMGNRLIAYQKLGYEAELAHKIHRGLLDLEKSVARGIAKMIVSEPIYVLYLSKIRGVGPALSAEIVAAIGDPARFDTISALWAYTGLDVRDGKAPRRTKGETANWNSRLRMIVVGRVVPSFIKLKGKECFGRDLYDQYKAFYVQRDGGTLTPKHVDNRARHKVAKIFLSCLWLAWMQIKGLPVSAPYAIDRLEHTHLVTPEDWAGPGWLNGSIQPMLQEQSEPLELPLAEESYVPST